jgi:CRP-like cAMP-binding protein
MESKSTVNAQEKNWFSCYIKPNEIELIEKCSTVVRYSKREMIVKKGEFATHVLVLLNGFVKVEINEGKKNFIIEIIPSPNIIGFSTLLSSDKYLFNVVALTDVDVRFIPVDAIKEIIESNGKFAYAAITFSNKYFTIPILEKLQCLSQNNIRGRLAKLLLHLSNYTHRNSKFTLLISRSEMAEMIGFSRENVIRMLTEFHKEGIISIKGKVIDLQNRQKLEEYAKNS